MNFEKFWMGREIMEACNEDFLCLLSLKVARILENNDGNERPFPEPNWIFLSHFSERHATLTSS
jgi:hypothetical protein